jgi:Flp pilus assembly pilin Flp
MKGLLTKLYSDEAGFIVSAELILISTIVVLGLIVGLSEVSHGVNQELEDVGSAIGKINQSYAYTGFSGAKGRQVGSRFYDFKDECDGQFDISCDGGASHESRGHRRHGRDY